MGRVLKFPSSPELTIYLPLGASDADEFEAIAIPDDSLSRGTIYKGDIVIIKLGLIRPSGLHAVTTPTGDVYVGFLVDKGNGLISIECNNDEYEPEIYRRDELQILGRVVQVYPGGNIQERWELIRSRPIAQTKIQTIAQ
jgi:SOS-response transcriptional repressor LexA